MTQIFGEANVFQNDTGILAYLAIIDKDCYIKERMQPYIDEILKIKIKNIINRGYFKDRNNLRLEGAQVLNEKGYEALFELALYWVENHMLYYNGPVSKHTILYNCDKDYWLFCRYHRVLQDKLRELGLYDKETKKRFNTIRRKYTQMHVKRKLAPSTPDRNIIAEANILISYSTKKDINIIESSELAVALDEPGEIKLVYGRNRPESENLIKATPEMIKFLNKEIEIQSHYVDYIDSNGWSRTNNGGYSRVLYKNCPCPGYPERFNEIFSRFKEIANGRNNGN